MSCGVLNSFDVFIPISGPSLRATSAEPEGKNMAENFGRPTRGSKVFNTFKWKPATCAKNHKLRNSKKTLQDHQGCKRLMRLLAANSQATGRNEITKSYLQLGSSSSRCVKDFAPGQKTARQEGISSCTPLIESMRLLLGTATGIGTARAAPPKKSTCSSFKLAGTTRTRKNEVNGDVSFNAVGSRFGPKSGVSHRRTLLLPAEVLQADLRRTSMSVNVNT